MNFFFKARAVPPLDSVLETIRAKYKMPAIVGAVLNLDRLVEMAAVGVRKSETTVPVTSGDLWHLGSDTKMMTALLAGSYIAEGKLSWSDKVISFFPEFANRLPEKELTVGQVLAHQAGLIENLKWRELAETGTVPEQRWKAAEQALTASTHMPGRYRYSNTGYVVVGAILEKLGGKSWEDLAQERIFKPLGMDSVGFGGTGTPGQIDQPWPHGTTGTPMPHNGPKVDNPPIMAPAGTVHCTMDDWAKFLIDQLRGGTVMKALLPNEIYTSMQTPWPKSEYGYGWIIVNRPWAGGKALTHAGANTMNKAVCWLAPEKKFGVAVCCNQGGDQASKACDEVAITLIKRYLAKA